jgi:potassium-dependent mechanosensitive channel
LKAILLLHILVMSMGITLGAVAAEPSTSDSASAASTDGGTPLPSAAQIEAKLAETSADTRLDDARKTALTEQYRRALTNLEAARTFDAKTGEFARALKSAPAETAEILKRIETRKPSDTPSARIPDDLSGEEINQRLGIVIADAAIEETRIGELDKIIERSAGRPGAIRIRLSEVKTALDELEADLSQPAADDSETEAVEARRWALETRRASLWAEGRMLEQELLSHTAREALYRAQRDEATLEWEALKAQQRRLDELQNQRRRAEAEAAQRESERAQLEASDKDPLVQQAAAENAEISASTGKLAQQLETLDSEIARTEAARKRIEQDFKASQERIRAAGLSKALGQVLVERRDQLPDLRQYRRAIQVREDEIAEATLRQIRYREDQRQLRDLARYLEDLAAHYPPARIDEVRGQMTETLEQRRRLIAQALVVEEDYIGRLGELNYAADQLIRTAEEYGDYLAERLLWVRSSLPVGVATLTSLPAVPG